MSPNDGIGLRKPFVPKILPKNGRTSVGQFPATKLDGVVLLMGDPGKLQMASRIPSETTLSVKWVAQRLHMGSWKNAHTTNLPDWKKRDPGSTNVRML